MNGAVQSGFTDITWTGLAWTALLVFIALALSWWQRLALEKQLLIGCLRTIVQLILIGYVLAWIIGSADWRLVLAASVLQLAAAAWTVGSLMQRPLPGARLIALVSLLPAYLLVLAVLLFLVIAHHPWWDPRLVLPIGGMLLGNSLTGVALALNRFRADLRSQRELVLARLALGTTWHTAVRELRQDAAHAAMLPTISALLTVGLVALPGMMTGQIIAGIDPVAAVKYQIAVMFMLAAVVALSAAIAITLFARRQRFDAEPPQTPEPAT